MPWQSELLAVGAPEGNLPTQCLRARYRLCLGCLAHIGVTVTAALRLPLTAIAVNFRTVLFAKPRVIGVPRFPVRVCHRRAVVIALPKLSSIYPNPCIFLGGVASPEPSVPCQSGMHKHILLGVVNSY